MRRTFALSLCVWTAGLGAFATSAVRTTAQEPSPRPARAGAGAEPPAQPQPSQTPRSPAPQGGIYRDANNLPEPQPLDQIQAPDIALPTAPIEPFLLTRKAGPFMIHAQTFRGPDAAKYAQLLAMELRNVNGLSAYVWRMKIKPGGNNIRGVAPTSDRTQLAGQANTPQAQARTYDEAAVLVGDCASVDEAESLLKQVKKIKPDCLQAIPSIMPWRKKDLCRAIITANPYIPAQDLFPRKVDPLVDRMNEGPHSIHNCPGPYTFQVTEFTGRSMYSLGGGAQTNQEQLFKTSPLQTAADDAEAFCAALLKDPEFRKLGLRPYVHHHRQGSRVTVGSFASETDPTIARLHKPMLDITMRMVVAGLDKDKAAALAKSDPNIARANFMKLTTDIFKSRVTSTPAMYEPQVVRVPK